MLRTNAAIFQQSWCGKPAQTTYLATLSSMLLYFYLQPTQPSQNNRDRIFSQILLSMQQTGKHPPQAPLE